jgi:hypothetical protein
MRDEFSYRDGPPREGADPNSRLGDPNPRKPHYQTGLTSAVNSVQPRSTTTLSREKPLRNPIECAPGRDENMTQNAPRHCDQVTRMGVRSCIAAEAAGGTPTGLTFADDNGLLRALPEPRLFVPGPRNQEK